MILFYTILYYIILFYFILYCKLYIYIYYIYICVCVIYFFIHFVSSLGATWYHLRSKQVFETKLCRYPPHAYSGSINVRFMSAICTSSTAQGGGGSFKNRKPIGEVGCCESGMAERSHWWTERCLRSPLFLSLSLSFSIYLSIHLSIYVSTFLSIFLFFYLSIYLSIHLI